MTKLLHFRKIFTIITTAMLIWTQLTGSPASGAAAGVNVQPDSAEASLSGANFDLIGHLGGAAQAIQVVGNIAYAGFGPEFAVLDVSDPVNIQRIGWVVAAGEVEDIAIDGLLAFVAYRAEYLGNYGPTGVQVIDIRHPTGPTVLATREYAQCGSAPQVVSAGSSAYLSYTLCSAFGGIIQNTGAELIRLEYTGTGEIIDHASIAFLPAVAEGIAKLANVIYWLFSDISGTSLKTFDVSSPEVLAEIGSTQVTDESQAIVIKSPYVFLAAGSYGLQVVDVSDPSNPSPAITYPLSSEAQVIALEGTSAYIGGDDPTILQVDVTNPLNPQVTGAYTTTGTSRDIFLTASSGYSANAQGGVEVFDAASLTRLGLMAVPWGVNAIAEVPPYAYAGADNGFWVLDISNPTAPQPIAHLLADKPMASVVLHGSYVYAACPNEGIFIFDVSNPMSPSVVGFYSYPEELHQQAVQGDTLYLAAGSAGLRILDISNPILLSEIGFYATAEGVNAVVVEGSLAYLAAGNGDLLIVDVADPSALQITGSYDPPQQVMGQTGTTVDFNDGIAYLGTVEPNPTPLAGFYTGDVWIIDASNPANPALVSSIPQGYGWAPYSLAVDAGTLYVVYERQGLSMYDLTNPGTPVEIGSFTPTETTHSAALGAEIAYLGGGSAYFLRYTHPGLPILAGRVVQANRLPYPGVLVSAGSPLLQDRTDEGGFYSIRGMPAGSYTLTPSLPGYVFAPASRVISLPPDAANQSFTVLAEPVQVGFIPGSPASLIYTDTQGLPTWLTIPGNAAASALTIEIVPTTGEDQPGYTFSGHAFELNATPGGERLGGVVFDHPLDLTIHYSRQDIAVVSDLGSLYLSWWNGSVWLDAAESCTPAGSYSRDEINRTLSLPICQTGSYRLIGPTNQVYLPRIFVE